MKTLEKKLTHLLNSTSAENGSDTPDFILAKFMMSCLDAFNTAVSDRVKWYGGQKYPWNKTLECEETKNEL